MNKRILTLEQLVQFCERSNLKTFSAKDTGYTLSVTIPAAFGEEVNSDRGILYAPIRICHTLLNRNGSFISEENMQRAMPSLKYRPFLATIHQLDDGSWDFHSHDINIIKDENGEEDFEYIEKQVGCITADEPYLEYDKEMDKTYVVGKVAIPEDYTRCANILREKKTSKVSCELNIESMSYNGKEHRLELEDFYFTGVTALGREKDGTEIGEGMLGSKVSIEDFSTDNNSVFSHIDENGVNKLFELLSSINSKLDKFENKSKSEEGGNTVETILENSDEIVEKTTTEKVVEETTEEENTVETEETVETDTTSESDVVEENETDVEIEVSEELEDPVIEQNSLKYSVTLGENTKDFSLSLDDIQYALYNLVNDTYSEVDNAFYSVTVYADDSQVVFSDWWNGISYRQSYSRDDDNFSLKGDRVQVYAQYLSQDEIDTLASIKEKADKYDYSVLEAERVSEIAKADYSAIAEKPEFIELAKEENHKNFSIDELKAKLNDIILDYAKAGQLNFEAQPEKKLTVTRLPIKSGNTKKSRYGNLFSKNEN